MDNFEVGKVIKKWNLASLYERCHKSLFFYCVFISLPKILLVLYSSYYYLYLSTLNQRKKMLSQKLILKMKKANRIIRKQYYKSQCLAPSKKNIEKYQKIYFIRGINL